MFSATRVKFGCFYLPSADELFGDLTPKSRAALEKIKHTERLPENTLFFSKGDLPRRIYRLREGKAQLFLNDEAKDEHLARLIEPNEIFGLTEALADLSYDTEAKTVTPCLCEFIERRDFICFLQEEPEACFRLARHLAGHFQKNYRLFSSIN